MGVYIRGMEMPKSCAECPLIYFYDERAWCHGGALCTHDWDEKLNEGRTEKCPLIEIQPHGRLIDADAFIKDIADAPTIIPAEEGECKVCANADNEYCFACDNGNQFKPITQKEEDE